ncbi:MAG: tetratricopeptide repeat protein [Elainella sp.]
MSSNLSAPFSPLTQLNEAILDCQQTLDNRDSPTAPCQRMGDLLQGLGRFQEAVFWHTAAHESPDYASLYASLGRLCIKQRQWERAIQYYEQAIAINPNMATVCRTLANLYSQQGDQQREVEFRYRALQLRPDWATARNQLKLGNLFMQLNQAKQAIECYQCGLRLDFNQFSIHYNLAVALTSQGQWSDAIAAYQQAIKLNPDHADSYYGLCKVAELENDLRTALTYCQQAVQLSPDSFAARYTLGTLFLKLERWEDAALAYRQGLELRPDFAWSHHNLGYALLKQGNFTEAVEKLSYAALHLPDSAWTHHHLGESFRQQKAWDEAIVAFLKAIQLQADLPGVYYRLGHVIRQRLATDLEAAIAQFQQQLPVEASAEFYAEVAALLQRGNQLDGAYFCYRLALHLRPNRSDWYSEVEQLWSKREQLHRRIDELRQDIQQDPNQSWLYPELGNLLANQGDPEEASLIHRQCSILRGWQRAALREYRFTHDWFTHNIPVWTEHLQRFVDAEVNALEIGSFEGMSTCWLLDYILTHPQARLTCIDLYFQENFDINVAKTGAPEKIIKLAAESHACLASLEPATYDLIYIDGNHLADHAQRDAALSWPLLKPGGLLIFDDYEWSDANYPGQETKVGIDAFIVSVRPQIEILYQGYQLIARKAT